MHANKPPDQFDDTQYELTDFILSTVPFEASLQRGNSGTRRRLEFAWRSGGKGVEENLANPHPVTIIKLSRVQPD